VNDRCPAPRRSVLATGLGVAALLLASDGQADVHGARKGARLAWARGVDADGCVGRIGLEEDVKARLGYDPFLLPGEVFVEGTIVRVSGGFRADLVMRDANDKLLGTRQLTSRERSCRTLGEAVAVAITVTIDPNAAGMRKSEEVEERSPDLEKPSISHAPPTPSPVSEDRLRGHGAVAIGAGAGLVPAIAPVVSIHARGNIGARWELGLGAHFWAESKTSGMGFALTTASVDGCVIPLDAIRPLRWCAGAHVGFLHVFVHAPELAPVTVGMVPWVGAETGPSVSLPLAGALRLEADLAAVVPITQRQAFARGRPGVVWEQSMVAGRASLGLGVSF
jgi:hypothetical protein